MSQLRCVHGRLTLLVLLVLGLLLAATPTVAQNDDEDEEEKIPPITVIVFANVMVNAERANGLDEEWQVRLSVRPLSKCTPSVGDGAHDTPWIDAGDEAGTRLSLEECVFSIVAVLREDSREDDCRFVAQLAWGTQPNDTDYVDNSLLTASRPEGESRLSIRRKPGSACARPNRTNFVIRGDNIVEALPEASANSDLLDLARRAAALAEFDVRVEPDPLPGTAGPIGCDRTSRFTVRGDSVWVPVVLHEASGSCPLRASVVKASGPFEALEGDTVSFDGAGLNILVELSSLVRLSPARIAIIQDVQGSNNRGAVSYTITRSCGDVTTSMPAATRATSTLHEGRYTVHGPQVAAFGATATYPVGATSTSSPIAGCSVSVLMAGLPDDCTVAGGPAQSLTWSAAAPIENFDFEFDVYCGDATPPPATPPTPVPADGVAETAPGDTAASESATPEVRLVARKLESGKIEFGLQQQLHDSSWGTRLLPRARLFPVGAGIGDWLVSSPLTVSVGASADTLAEDIALRIVARLASDGRVEFGLQQRTDGAEWSDRQMPARRFFPSGARVDRWLRSSVVTLTL